MESFGCFDQVISALRCGHYCKRRDVWVVSMRLKTVGNKLFSISIILLDIDIWGDVSSVCVTLEFDVTNLLRDFGAGDGDRTRNFQLGN